MCIYACKYLYLQLLEELERALLRHVARLLEAVDRLLARRVCLLADDAARLCLHEVLLLQTTGRVLGRTVEDLRLGADRRNSRATHHLLATILTSDVRRHFILYAEIFCSTTSEGEVSRPPRYVQ